MFKNALVSVSDKTGLIDLILPLAKSGTRIVSTGGTAEYLRQNGINVVDISEQTGFPEVMDGRVKTLHPNVHMALLANIEKPQHVEVLKKFNVENFDLVVVNLYPFEDAVKSNSSFPELIEKIDIGGPSMLRSAAKNFKTIAVLCDPRDYANVIEKKFKLDSADRQRLAAKVFAHTSVYDSLIAQKLGECKEVYPFGGREIQSLRYGENPQQNASWYALPGENKGLHSAKILQGKELSYNNILDLDAATSLVREFSEPAVVAVKHNNPCGVAADVNILFALKKALSSDPISVFGGIIAINREVNAEQAQALAELFLECIVAPQFSSEAKNIFAKKKNLRILEWPEMLNYKRKNDLRTVAGGFVVQSVDTFTEGFQHWQILGEKPNDAITQDLMFAEKVAGALKSNSIAIVENKQTIGLGMGQVNRVEAVEHAIKRMKTHHSSAKTPVLASDAFFPFADSIEVIARAGIRWIIQPGGSVKDAEVKAAAQEYNVNMILTGHRHFRH